MTYTDPQRARYVGLRLDELRTPLKDALNETDRMESRESEELGARLDLILDAVADAKDFADGIMNR